jgi:tetratricopeptide (TPR) repeat protein
MSEPARGASDPGNPPLPPPLAESEPPHPDSLPPPPARGRSFPLGGGPPAQKVADLLRAWDALRGQGRETSAEALCRDCPELLAEVRERIRALQAFARPADSAAPTPDLATLAAAPTGPLAQAPASWPEVPGYKILGELGRGGMGVVYQARQVRLDRLVALKMILSGGHAGAAERARFRAEAEAVARLQHPNIVQVYEVGEADGNPFFSLELVDGGSLAERLDGTPLPAREAAALVQTLAQAVDHAHRRGVVHRDLKPANILLTPNPKSEIRNPGQTHQLERGRPTPEGPAVSDFSPKVTDFGLAKRLGPQKGQTQSGAILGTPSYMAPEQAGGRGREVGPAADVYALGAVLYELLTGRPPFKAETPLDTLIQVVSEEPVPPSRLNAKVPRDLETVCLKCLQKSPARRYAAAHDLAEDLRRFLAGEPVSARPAGPLEKAAKWARRRPAVAALWAVGVAAVLLGGGSLLWWQTARAVRRAQTTRAVEQVLSEALGLRGRAKEGTADVNRWSAALAAAKRADGLLSQGEVDDDLRRRVSDLVAELEAEGRDRRMAQRLEEILLRKIEIRDGRFDTTGADRDYAAAFRAYGIDLARLSDEAAARHIRGRPIRGRLVAGLDDWAVGGWADLKGGAAGWKRLVRVARLADGNRWRNRLREALTRRSAKALTRRDLEILKALAREARAADLPPSTLVWLGMILRQVDLPRALELLGGARQRYPGDFWVNQDLAVCLLEAKPPQPDEALRCLSAALALRPRSPAVYLNYGNALQVKGRREEAAVYYRRAIRLQEDYADAHYNLGTLLDDLGRTDEAIACLRRAIRFNKDLAQAHHNLGFALYAKGRVDEALACYRRSLRLQDNNPKAHANLGYALLEHGRVDEAIPCFRRALHFQKDFPVAHCNLGYALFDKGRLDEAVACFREAIRLRPGYAEAHNGLGIIFSRQGRADEEVACYRQAVRCKRDYAEAHLNLGLALRRKGLLDDAIASLREALRFNLRERNERALAYFSLGSALTDRGRRDEAALCYKEAVHLRKDYVEAHYNLGNVLADMGRSDEAIACYREAIRLRKDYYLAHHNLGNRLRERGRLDEAIACFRRTIALKKDYDRGHCNLGYALFDKGRLDEAVACFRQALRLNPAYAEAHQGLGSALYRKGRPDEAIVCLRQAIQLKPTYALAHHNLGVAFSGLGRWDEAVTSFRQAVRSKKDYADAQYGLGTALAAGGRLDQAVLAYREAIRLKQDFAQAHCNLGAALLAQGQFRAALAALRRGHRLGSKDPNWAYPSGEWLRAGERLLRLEGKLPAFLRGKYQPADAAERVELAAFCAHYKRRYAAAARLYREAFAAEPRLADALRAGHRSRAAVAAARAGCGQGVDAAGLRPAERAELRGQALEWLRADLAAWRGHSEGGQRAQALRYWRADQALAGVRDKEGLAKLPPAERAAWAELWAEVEKLVKRAR